MTSTEYMLNIITPLFRRTRKFLDIVPTRGPNALNLLLNIVERVNKELGDDIRQQMQQKKKPTRQGNYYCIKIMTFISDM